jgi:ATP-binding cassette subfamily F protein 3
MKMLDKMGVPEKLDGIMNLVFSFKEADAPARYVTELTDVSFSYGQEGPLLIDGLTVRVAKDDKICVIGRNGKGKTTLMKLMAGILKPTAGRIKEHPRTRQAYFEQGNTAILNDNSTVEEELSTSCEGSMKNSVRSICGAMMFSGDDALKKISVLSGGEKSRVLLGKTLLAPSNFLMLDEPTHHLDIESCQAIIRALRSFSGAAVIVTHDEGLIRGVAKKLIVFQGEHVTVFPGTYDEFLEQVGWEDEPLSAPGQSGQEPCQTKMSRKEVRRMRAEKARKVRPYEQRVRSIENEIEKAEKEIARLTSEMVIASEKGDTL